MMSHRTAPRSSSIVSSTRAVGTQFRLALLATLAVAFAVPATILAADEIPAAPDEIEFGDLAFEPPEPAEYRHELPGGVVVYLLPDRALPLIDVSFSFSGGTYLNPEGKAGLAGITASMLRRGGTTTVAPEELDERFDFLAAQVGSGSGDDWASASLNSLTANFDEAFALFMDMLRNPGFDAARYETLKSEIVESMKQRNDSGDAILGREWSALLYGRDHHEGSVATISDIESITVEDMRAFHEKIYHPGNLVIGITGDFETQAMLDRLAGALEGWAAGERPAPPPAPTADLEPGVYYVEKDIPQGKVRIGFRGVTRDHPDSTTLRVMNLILGGGGFTSRITNKVRTEEGLAYSAGSAMMPNYYYPGEFRAYFSSKSRTCALATKLILEEVDRIRTEPVTAEELEVAKASVIETFPRAFESKKAVRNLFVGEEWQPHREDFYSTYRDRVRAITAEDIQRVAQEHLDPSKLAILMVGRWEEIAPGDLEGRASMADFFEGEATQLPLRDPLTQEPIGP